jgi:hypothetical protein
MSAVAEKTDPKLWDKVKAKVTKSSKGGKAGQWSARKAQLATHEYQAAGGGYKGKKAPDNHLEQWQEEDWGTKSGHKSGETGERYLPKQAREHLTDAEYKRTTAKKRTDSRKGKQFSAQPEDVARKTAKDRATGHATNRQASGGPSKAELMQKARAKNVPGRSKMTKAQLEKAVA